MNRKGSFNAFALNDAANGKHFAGTAATTSNHDATEDLDPLFLAFQNPRVHVDRIADAEFGHVSLEAALFD